MVSCTSNQPRRVRITRREGRRFRRQEKRRLNRKKQVAVYDNIDNVINIDNLYNSLKKCCRGTRWKYSVQKYLYSGLSELASVRWELYRGAYCWQQYSNFTVYERGKLRSAYAPCIQDRVIQMTMIDYAIMPVIERSIVNTNCASLKGRGVRFAEQQLRNDLQEYYRKYNTNAGFVLCMDLHNYFGSIDREPLYTDFSKIISDKAILNLLRTFLDTFKCIDVFKDCGVGLGAPLSQLCGIFATNSVDHFVREVLPAERGMYCRYGDDIYILGRNYADLVACMKILTSKYLELGLQVNLDKCRIMPLSGEFVWLKKRVKLTDSGRVIMQIGSKAIKFMRRNLKIRAEWVKDGRWTFAQYENCFRSWAISTLRYYNSVQVVRSMQRLFEKEFYSLLGSVKVLQLVLQEEHVFFRVGIVFIEFKNGRRVSIVRERKSLSSRGLNLMRATVDNKLRPVRRRDLHVNK